MAKPVGILGGTFDPVHHGHLRLALECRQRLDLAEVRIIPVHTPPHRVVPVAAPGQRLRMVELAAGGSPDLAADDLEIRRGGPSYTVDTLRALRAALGERPVCLILGIDAFRLLHQWRQWTALLELVHLIVAQRPGADEEVREPALRDMLDTRGITDPARLGAAMAGSVLRLEIPRLDISASQVRRLLAAGHSARYLLPDAVLGYIEEQGLYRKPATSH